MKRKLNLGSSQDYREGWINLDIYEGKDIYGHIVKADVIWDLNNYPYPFPDNTFDEIEARAIIEHLESRTKSWKELWRIARNGCKIHVYVPHYSGCAGYDDPTHYHRYSFDSGWRIANMFGFKYLGGRIDFSTNKWLKWINPLVNLYPRFYERFLASIFSSQGIFWEFEVIKNEKET